jgi:hypothetical protein
MDRSEEEEAEEEEEEEEEDSDDVKRYRQIKCRIKPNRSPSRHADTIKRT